MEEDYRGDACFHTGCCFIKSGLWFFIIGLILGFAVLIHYIVGSRYDTSQLFLSNVTLWFGSPLTLSVGYLQLGGLAMAILGMIHCCKAKCHTAYATDRTANVTDRTGNNTNNVCASCCARNKKTSLSLCYVGLIALAVTGFLGYFVLNWIWPGFYYEPIQIAKNLWLILQGVSIVVFLVGFILATCCCCKHKRDISYNR